MRPAHLLAAVAALSPVATAISNAFDNIRGLSDAKNALFVRQDDASSEAPRSTAPSSTSTSDDDDSPSSTRQVTSSARASGSQGTRTTGRTQSVSFDARLPAGGVSMVTPNALAGDQFYKVGDWVTFAWNYTSLSVTPSNIDVMASCSANQATYTIAVNMSAAETKVLWDTKDTPSGQAPFLTEKYTLLIYDSASEATAAPRAGYLAAFSQFTFGMYTPQPRVDRADFRCANCVTNSALSPSERMTLNVLLFTTGTTVASLLFFTHNFGLW